MSNFDFLKPYILDLPSSIGEVQVSACKEPPQITSVEDDFDFFEIVSNPVDIPLDNSFTSVITQNGEIKSVRHRFFSISNEEVPEAESRTFEHIKFPQELKDFYFQVGCGSVYWKEFDLRLEILHPEEVIDRILLEGDYEYLDELRRDEEWEETIQDDELPFMGVKCDDEWVTIKFKGENDGSIYFRGNKVAQSIEEFFRKIVIGTDK